MSGKPPSAGAAGDPDDKMMSALIAMMRGAEAGLDDIEEPTAADLAAMEDLDDLTDVAAPPAEAVARRAPLAFLAPAEEPELLSLETLDDAGEDLASGDELDDIEALPEEADALREDYIDVALDDDELDDEGYDLDDDDIESYHDLYGDDDTIIPSFREGEFAEEEDGDTDYYNELR